MQFFLHINRLTFLVTHNTLHFDTNARKLMPVKDLDHLRLWTSNVVPFRIQLQFWKTKVQLFSTQPAGNKGFQALGRFSAACTKLVGSSAYFKELVRLELVNPIPVLQQVGQLEEKTLLQLLSHPSADHLFPF